MNECHFDERSEVFGCLFKASEDAACFFQPSDQALHDISPAVCFPIEFDWPRPSVLIHFGRNDGLDVSFQQVFVDPIGAVSFVPAQRYGPSHWFASAVMQARVGTF